jgi:hypothetical protein
MPLIWTSLHSTATWKTPPGPPRVTRAAIPGLGWLVATEVAGGWSTAFVPDTAAADPPDREVCGNFQAAKTDWRPRAPSRVVEAKPNSTGQQVKRKK